MFLLSEEHLLAFFRVRTPECCCPPSYPSCTHAHTHTTLRQNKVDMTVEQVSHTRGMAAAKGIKYHPPLPYHALFSISIATGSQLFWEE